jgi:hypothetical protein
VSCNLTQNSLLHTVTNQVSTPTSLTHSLLTWRPTVNLHPHSHAHSARCSLHPLGTCMHTRAAPASRTLRPSEPIMLPARARARISERRPACRALPEAGFSSCLAWQLASSPSAFSPCVAVWGSFPPAGPERHPHQPKVLSEWKRRKSGPQRWLESARQARRRPCSSHSRSSLSRRRSEENLARRGWNWPGTRPSH